MLDGGRAVEGIVNNEIEHAQQPNIRHESIEVPNRRALFPDEIIQVFRTVWAAYKLADSVPVGYGVHEDKCEGDWEIMEVLQNGKRGRRELEMALPEHTWWPHTIAWAKGLYLMNHLVNNIENV